jgi:hypothetical protein
MAAQLARAEDEARTGGFDANPAWVQSGPVWLTSLAWLAGLTLIPLLAAIYALTAADRARVGAARRREVNAPR